MSITLNTKNYRTMFSGFEITCYSSFVLTTNTSGSVSNLCKNMMWKVSEKILKESTSSWQGVQVHRNMRGKLSGKILRAYGPWLGVEFSRNVRGKLSGKILRAYGPWYGVEFSRNVRGKLSEKVLGVGAPGPWLGVELHRNMREKVLREEGTVLD